jgi:mannan endo-1,4-beta-mannosidase
MQPTTSNSSNSQIIRNKIFGLNGQEFIAQGLYGFTWDEIRDIYLDTWGSNTIRYPNNLFANDHQLVSESDNEHIDQKITDIYTIQDAVVMFETDERIGEYEDNGKKIGVDLGQSRTQHNPSISGEYDSNIVEDDFTPTNVNMMLASLKFANFKTIGNRIYDPNGQEFIAKGINAFTWDQTYDTYLKSWGFNTIRVPNYLLGSYNQPHPAQDDYKTNKKIVDVYTSQGAVVIFDAHDRIGGYYEGNQWEILKDYWRSMAQQFKDNPYVWFNLHNEPGDSQAQTEKWVDYHRQLVDIIRGEGAKNVIVVDGEAWGQDYHTRTIAKAAQNVMAGNENIVFSLHVYDQWVNQDIGAYFDQLQAQDIPVIVGEYGSENIGRSVIQASSNMMSAAQSREIGRIAWVGIANDNNDLTYEKGGHAYYFNGTNTEILTELGSLAWEDLQRTEDLGYADHNFWTRFTSPDQASIAATQGIYKIVSTNVSGNKNFANQSQSSIFISGDVGNNKFQGGDKDDVLIGGDGSDRLSGQDGNDLLVGGKGDDDLIGGSGNDVFYIDGRDGGKDIITDFNPENDALYINNVLEVAQAWTKNGLDKTNRYGHLGALRVTNLEDLADLTKLLKNMGGNFGAYSTKNQNQLVLDLGDTIVQLNDLGDKVHITQTP